MKCIQLNISFNHNCFLICYSTHVLRTKWSWKAQQLFAHCQGNTAEIEKSHKKTQLELIYELVCLLTLATGSEKEQKVRKSQ